MRPGSRLNEIDPKYARETNMSTTSSERYFEQNYLTLNLTSRITGFFGFRTGNATGG